MLPRKTGKPIAIKCTEQLRQQTEAIADSLGESLSDYVRKAIEQRNAMEKVKAALGTPDENKTVQQIINEPSILIKTHNRMIAERDNSIGKHRQMVKSFMKEGKK